MKKYIFHNNKNLLYLSLFLLLGFLAICALSLKHRVYICEKDVDCDEYVRVKFKNEEDTGLILNMLTRGKKGKPVSGFVKSVGILQGSNRSIVKWEGEFKNGIRNGILKEYFYNNNNELEGETYTNYKDGTEISSVHYAYNEKGQLEGEGSCFLVKDNRICYSEEYYEDRQLGREKLFIDDKPVGTWHTYYDNGQLKLKEVWLDFRGEEVYKEYYYSNGNLKEGGKYKNPYWKVGIWEYYDENGNLTKREKYNYYGKLEQVEKPCEIQ